MENGQEATAKPNDKLDLNRFVEDMMEHARELHAVLRRNDGDDSIKDRITCLKYLEEVTKTYFILKRASTHDPAAAGSTVRKYATAFAKNATGGGTKGRRGRKPAFGTGADFESDDLGGDGGDTTAA